MKLLVLGTEQGEHYKAATEDANAQMRAIVP